MNLWFSVLVAVDFNFYQKSLDNCKAAHQLVKANKHGPGKKFKKGKDSSKGSQHHEHT